MHVQHVFEAFCGTKSEEAARQLKVGQLNEALDRLAAAGSSLDKAMVFRDLMQARGGRRGTQTGKQGWWARGSGGHGEGNHKHHARWWEVVATLTAQEAYFRVPGSASEQLRTSS